MTGFYTINNNNDNNNLLCASEEKPKPFHSISYEKCPLWPQRLFKQSRGTVASSNAARIVTDTPHCE